jgi:hypothetical protein
MYLVGYLYEDISPSLNKWFIQWNYRLLFALQLFVSPNWIAGYAGGMFWFLSLKAALIRSCFSNKNIRTATVIDDGVGLTTSWNFCVVVGGELLVNPFNK